MGDLSELVLESLVLFRKQYDTLPSGDPRRASLVNTYFRVVDAAYGEDISRVIAYKRLWYTARKEDVR